MRTVPLLRGSSLRSVEWMLKAGITVKMKNNHSNEDDLNDGPLCSEIKSIRWTKVKWEISKHIFWSLEPTGAIQFLQNFLLN